MSLQKSTTKRPGSWRIHSSIILLVFGLSGCANNSIASLEEIRTVCLGLVGQDLNDTDKSKDFLSSLGSDLAVIKANDPEKAETLLLLVAEAKEQVSLIQTKATNLRLELALNKSSATATIEEMNAAHMLIENIEKEIEEACIPFLKK
jgi:hypothetical protein